MATATRHSAARLSVRLPQALVVEYGYIFLAIAMRIASGPTANLSYVALAAYALTGRAQAIKALALSWLFTMLSPGIGAEASFATVGRFLVIGGAAAAVLLRSRLARGRPQASKFVFATVLLGGFFVIHALLFSPYPAVSVLKALSWTLAITTLLAAWLGLSGEARDWVAAELFGGLAILMLVSLPLIAMPLGYLRNASGFQGILNHPQVFGPTMALLGAWAASQLLALRRPGWPIVALTGVCPVLILLSEARTAGLALVLGVGVAVVIVPFLSGRRLTAMAPGLKSRRFVALASVAAMGLLLAGPGLADRIGGYLAKGTASDTLTEAYYTSRGRLMMEMWENIEAQPLRGIGFGIASNSWDMLIKRDPLLGLPVGASIEKGVMPLAVLEELGVPGFLAVTTWIFVLFRRSARTSISCLAVTLTALLTNMGDSTLFSPGGWGMLSLILLAWGATGSRSEKNVASRGHHEWY
ncbi:hypothetical protein [Arhodomonas sp. SL1]|uniref:hypothetical protein n=1 Tax=Arhodomonas sp. SL1 TaxID=3425691 RepID=UPI003F8836D1